MTEKINIKGKDVWIVIEPHAQHTVVNDSQEYFTASYHSTEPGENPGGILFLNEDQAPVMFKSPVQALEFANEKLLGIL